MLLVYDWQQDTLPTFDDLADTRVFRCCAYDTVADQCPLHAEKCAPCLMQACAVCNDEADLCPLCAPYVCCCGHDDDGRAPACACEVCRMVRQKCQAERERVRQDASRQGTSMPAFCIRWEEWGGQAVPSAL